MVRDELARTIKSADAAVTFAQDVRSAHRKRSLKGTRPRETDIALALQRLRRAMGPIRAELARVARDNGQVLNSDQREKLAETSAAIQRERRKLWKMQTHKRRRR